jgi:hypothetical protein
MTGRKVKNLIAVRSFGCQSMQDEVSALLSLKYRPLSFVKFQGIGGYNEGKSRMLKNNSPANYLCNCLCYYKLGTLILCLVDRELPERPITHITDYKCMSFRF